MLPLYPRLLDSSPAEVAQLHREHRLSGFAELCQGVAGGLELRVQGPFQQGVAHTEN